ncbi:hypothetical protein AM2010_551 [Pelagerythrobacter marensis]|uniref:Uncharacterized protein n=1 Tax=Pelagerythrobacter marensis TaxID=543877 RepID=A0A0G3X8G6_9SPHN|nr:hypothetical protein AM2010_551 [Pelagerythrobacter marensis]
MITLPEAMEWGKVDQFITEHDTGLPPHIREGGREAG